MDESRKTSLIRGQRFADTYLRGRVIDIGAGSDLVCTWAERFDIEDGDANRIVAYRQKCSYDAVHSSHCLEHMHNPENALLEWWSLLKPGGFLVVVVPDEDLYEQGIWPSIFAADHKATFRLDKPVSWSPVSFDIRSLVSKLPNCEIISAEIQDRGYRHSLKSGFGDKHRNIRGLGRIYSTLRKIPVLGIPLQRLTQRLAFVYGVPVDQTLGDAVAQIQVVARKRL